MGHPYQILDVFTDRPLAGNPLAVVFDADDLATDDMQRIAGEFNLSETVFFLTPESAAHSARMRIFTPVSEMPFAGHPTVGGAVAFALARGNGAAAVNLSLPAGPVAATFAPRPGGGVASFDAPLVPKVVDGTADPAAIATALGLSPADLGFEGLVPVGASSGPTFTMVPLGNASSLARIRLDTTNWAAAFAQPLSAAFCVARTGPATFQARMFAPLQGITEDPATGSAAVAFAALLAPLLPPDGTHEITIDQGIEMGRPSAIGLAITLSGAQSPPSASPARPSRCARAPSSSDRAGVPVASAPCRVCRASTARQRHGAYGRDGRCWRSARRRAPSRLSRRYAATRPAVGSDPSIEQRAMSRSAQAHRRSRPVASHVLAAGVRGLRCDRGAVRQVRCCGLWQSFLPNGGTPPFGATAAQRAWRGRGRSPSPLARVAALPIVERDLARREAQQWAGSRGRGS